VEEAAAHAQQQRVTLGVQRELAQLVEHLPCIA
jgi:hypothetical protein